MRRAVVSPPTLPHCCQPWPSARSHQADGERAHQFHVELLLVAHWEAAHRHHFVANLSMCVRARRQQLTVILPSAGEPGVMCVTDKVVVNVNAHGLAFVVLERHFHLLTRRLQSERTCTHTHRTARLSRRASRTTDNKLKLHRVVDGAHGGGDVDQREDRHVVYRDDLVANFDLPTFGGGAGHRVDFDDAIDECAAETKTLFNIRLANRRNDVCHFIDDVDDARLVMGSVESVEADTDPVYLCTRSIQVLAAGRPACTTAVPLMSKTHLHPRLSHPIRLVCSEQTHLSDISVCHVSAST